MAAAYVNSIQIISVYYAAGDSDAYAPDLAYISGIDTEAGSVTLCFKNTEEEEDTTHLTLVAHRVIKPVSERPGQYIVRVAMPDMQIDLHVCSAEAQHYWIGALALDSQHGLTLSVDYPRRGLISFSLLIEALTTSCAERAGHSLNLLTKPIADDISERKAKAGTDTSTVCEILTSMLPDAYNCRVTEI